MTRDFTLHKYRQLLIALQTAGYRFLTFQQYCDAKEQLGDTPFVILRHDVDARPLNSLHTAQIEHQLGICASYYFRIVPASNQPQYIRAIADLGHEIGYHYEDMAVANGDVCAAIKHFERNLSYFRQFYPVRTVCMHGAPTSLWDGRDIWKSYDYHDYGVVGEPYFDVDFSRVFYLTDTGRRFDGFHVSIRDTVPVYQQQWIDRGWLYHSTDDLIRALQKPHPNTNDKHPQTLPAQLMITTHPQRWTDNPCEWARELITQSFKNIIKYAIIKASKQHRNHIGATL